MDFVEPEIRCLGREDDTYAKFSIQPLERGFGTTLGNALRRVLLFFVPGAAITSVQINEVLHEFATIPGVYEDVVEITLNLKEVYVKVDDSVFPNLEEPITLTLQKSGKGRVVAGDIEVPAGVEIVNQMAHIATLTDDSASLSMNLTVQRGIGYAPIDDHRQARPKSIGVIPVDAVFTPTQRVSFQVEPTRRGKRTDYDRLILEVWTNGTVPPSDAITFAARWLDRYLHSLFLLPTEVEIGVEEGALAIEDSEILGQKIADLEFSVRTSNCLRRERIETVGDLITKTRAELLSIRNFGRKSLAEVEEKLQEMGLSLRKGRA